MSGDKLGKVNLGINIHKDFDDSAAFIGTLGHFVCEGDFFLPGKGGFKRGDIVTIHFTLGGGRRDILKGRAQITSVHPGGGGLPRGIHLRWIEMDERTTHNLAMVADWQADNPVRK